jgi:hypothetical protein
MKRTQKPKRKDDAAKVGRPQKAPSDCKTHLKITISREAREAANHFKGSASRICEMALIKAYKDLLRTINAASKAHDAACFKEVA